ncbi:MAG: DNA repair protein RadA [Bacteroidales bacterium]|nr:DNA repair protein RadA [Bacteroidales bacterium]MBN2763173.1 DNA repair protein RadA [Bacteroidales bacterium]
MAKSKIVYYCRNCGAEAPKWLGRCPSCGQWNTYVEEVVRTKTPSEHHSNRDKDSRPLKLTEISSAGEERLNTGIGEFNRVLGGGLVKGSVVLLGGEPGIGKSTLALQMALSLDGEQVLYVSGEESNRQIKIRAERLGLANENCYFLSETSLDAVFNQITNLRPGLIIIDSVQTLQDDSLDSSPGSISQVRECAARLLRLAKETSTPVILIGHITKDGTLAGPKVLEHIVDTVLIFEGDHHYVYRILRPVKNRFGTTAELGIFEMLQSGLREVVNPSEILINKNNEGLSGIAIGATIDGIRPFLIEVQALVSTAAYGMPQRIATGYDVRRLNMLLAVLEKRAGFKLATRDVFLNIAGGIKINDPGLDLAVIIAVLSSNFDKPVHKNICMSAEIGLSGEIRTVSRIEQRIREAAKLGYKKILISSGYENKITIPEKNITIVSVSKVEEALKYLFASER